MHYNWHLSSTMLFCQKHLLSINLRDLSTIFLSSLLCTRKVKQVFIFLCTYNSSTILDGNSRVELLANTPQFEFGSLTRCSVHVSFNRAFLDLQECGTRISRAPRNIKRKLAQSLSPYYPVMRMSIARARESTTFLSAHVFSFIQSCIMDLILEIEAGNRI